MSDCALCSSEIGKRALAVQCCGPCLENFHARCVNLSKTDIIPGMSWRCGNCRDSKERQATVEVGNGTPETESSLPVNILMDIQSNIKSLNTKYESFMDSVNFCSDKISDFEVIVNKLSDKIATIEKLTKENNDLKITVKNLTSRLDIVEQQLRVNNVEIQGVPEKNNENIIDLVKFIGEKIEYSLDCSDIDSAYRGTVPQNSKKIKPIIIKFSNKHKRDSFLSASKLARSKSQNNGGIILENIGQNIYINEHLTIHSKILLYKTKEMAKNSSYKYVWVRNGTIFTRKDDKSKILRISLEDDINKMQ